MQMTIIAKPRQAKPGFFLGLKEAFIGLSVLDSALYAPPLPVTNELADAKAHAQ